MDAESDIIDLTHPPMPIASSPITEAGGGSAGETSSFGDGVLIIGSGDVVQVREGDEGGAAYAEVDTALTGAVATHTVVDESAEDLASDRAVSAGLTTGDTGAASLPLCLVITTRSVYFEVQVSCGMMHLRPFHNLKPGLLSSLGTSSIRYRF